MIKLSADQMQKLAQIEAADRKNAIEFGFAKAARDLGLDGETFPVFYRKAMEKLAAQRRYPRIGRMSSKIKQGEKNQPVWRMEDANVPGNRDPNAPPLPARYR